MMNRRLRHSLRPARRRLAMWFLAASVGFGACSDGSTGPVPNPDGEEYDHGAAPGASARDFLSAADFDRLVVQVQYVEGFRPSDQGLQHLEDFLLARLNKPGGVEIQIGDPLPAGSQATYTAAEIRALEEEHRTAYTEGSTLAAYLLFVDGEYEENAGVLGIAYNNTSMAVFQEKIEENTGGVLLQSKARVEGAVANHEAGHLLGLVDNGSDMQAPHRDEQNGKHCQDENCLMHYAVRMITSIEELLAGMPELDEDCLDDLRANGGK